MDIELEDNKQFISNIPRIIKVVDTLSGEVNLSKLFCFPFEKGSIPKGKKGSKFFPFRVDPFQKGHDVQKNQQEVTKIVFLVKLGETL